MADAGEGEEVIGVAEVIVGRGQEEQGREEGMWSVTNVVVVVMFRVCVRLLCRPLCCLQALTGRGQ